MPAVDFEHSVAAGPVTATGASYVATGASCTLAAGRWVVMGSCSHVNASGGGGVTSSSEVEFRHNSTRLALSRWCSIFGAFRPTSGDLSGGAVGGSAARDFAVINASASDTVSMHVRAVDVGSGFNDALAGDAVIDCINLDLLTEGVDYVYAETANSDTADVVASGTSWVTGSAAGRIGQGASEVPFTAPSTGDYYVRARVENFVSGAVGSAEAARMRLRLNGATIGSGVEQLVTQELGSPTAFIIPLVDEAVIPLTMGDQPELQIEVSNVSGGVAMGYRRFRILLIRLAAFRNYTVSSQVDGLQQAGSGDPESSTSCTFDYGTGVDVFLTACPTWQSGGGDWGSGRLHQDSGDVRFPPLGRIDAYNTGRENVGTGGDINCQALHTIGTFTGSQSFRLGMLTRGGVNHTYGRNHANSADANTRIVAFELYTADSATTFTPDAQRIRFQDGTPTATMARSVTPASERMRVRDTAPTPSLGAVSNTPASQRARVQDGAPTASLGAVSVAPASARARFQDGAPTVTLGALAVTPTTERLRIRDASLTASVGAVAASLGAARMRFRDGTLSLTIPDVYTPAAGRVRFVDASPTVLLGARVYTPSAQRIRFRTGTVAGNAVIVGALRMGVREDQLFGGVVNEAQRFGLDVNDVD